MLIAIKIGVAANLIISRPPTPCRKIIYVVLAKIAKNYLARITLMFQNPPISP
jgi:hypothetical protein